MKGFSVLFTIFLFLLAGKLAHQLKQAGALPAQEHTEAGVSAAASESGAGAQPRYANSTFDAHANYN